MSGTGRGSHVCTARMALSASGCHAGSSGGLSKLGSAASEPSRFKGTRISGTYFGPAGTVIGCVQQPWKWSWNQPSICAWEEGDICSALAVGEPSEASCCNSLLAAALRCGVSLLNSRAISSALNLRGGSLLSSPDFGFAAASTGFGSGVLSCASNLAI